MILSSCARNEAAETVVAPPRVHAAKVVSKSITEFDEFTGRFEAVERVEVRPRVSGYVLTAHFAQGHEVKKGEILYVIDPRPYQATLKHAQAELARARTQLALAKSEGERAAKLAAARAISQEEFDARTSVNERSSAADSTAASAACKLAAACSLPEVRASNSSCEMARAATSLVARSPSDFARASCVFARASSACACFNVAWYGRGSMT